MKNFGGRAKLQREVRDARMVIPRRYHVPSIGFAIRRDATTAATFLSYRSPAKGCCGFRSTKRFARRTTSLSPAFHALALELRDAPVMQSRAITSWSSAQEWENPANRRVFR
jgi:hypothetical protein